MFKTVKLNVITNACISKVSVGILLQLQFSYNYQLNLHTWCVSLVNQILCYLKQNCGKQRSAQ